MPTTNGDSILGCPTILEAIQGPRRQTPKTVITGISIFGLNLTEIAATSINKKLHPYTPTIELSGCGPMMYPVVSQEKRKYKYSLRKNSIPIQRIDDRKQPKRIRRFNDKLFIEYATDIE